jgi:hypothetical protein
VAHSNRIYSANVVDGVASLLVGRLPGCDIQIDGPRMSRCHALFFYIPSLKRIIVADGGSALGIGTLQRSNGNNQLVHSLPGQRACLAFDDNEKALLTLQPNTHYSRDMVSLLTLNPLECLICYDAPRSITLTCGHHVACNKCNQSLTICPLCRRPIDNLHIKVEFATQTAPGVDIPVPAASVVAVPAVAPY